jgi:hypothetical protein
MNRLIHASVVEHFDTKLDLVLFITQPRQEVKEEIMLRNVLRKPTHEAIEQVLFISSDEGAAVLISIRDMISASIEIADKIIDACNDQRIFLEHDISR